MKLKKAKDKFTRHAKESKNLSELTIRAYDADLRCLIKFAGNLDVASINHAFIHTYRAHLQTTLSLKPTTTKRRLATIRCLLHWLCDSEILTELKVKKGDFSVKLPSSLPKALTSVDLTSLFLLPLQVTDCPSRESFLSRINSCAMSKQVFRQFTTLICVDLLYATGIRVGELCQITLSDIDQIARTIHIHGKGDRERKVYIPCDGVAQTLDAFKTTRKQFSGADPTLIIRANGSSADTQYVRKLIRECAESAGISQRITPHMIRHTTATHLVGEGVDIRFVQRLLGHQSITTTQIYTHVSDNALKARIEERHPIRGLIAMK